MFLPHLAEALGEFRRVLKPGGRLGVSTWQVSQTEDVTEALVELGLQTGHPPGWLTEPERLERLLHEAGFREVSVAVDTYDARYTDLNQYWRTAQGTGQRATIDGLNATQREELRAALAERFQSRTRADGLHIEARALLATATR
jgi:hypothetical protein